ncbi:MAG: hypothetical protein JWR69_4099, partial [Pedosphaera sp.]|nr:hypothetical protein [Pedosphaera sp.]
MVGLLVVAQTGSAGTISGKVHAEGKAG